MRAAKFSVSTYFDRFSDGGAVADAELCMLGVGCLSLTIIHMYSDEVYLQAAPPTTKISHHIPAQDAISSFSSTLQDAIQGEIKPIHATHETANSTSRCPLEKDGILLSWVHMD